MIVRDLIAAGLDAPVTVMVRKGIYRTDGISFNGSNSGTSEYPIHYEAEGNVVIDGGIRMKASDFEPPDEIEKARLHGEAKEKVVKADLKKYGLTRADWGEICAVGYHITAGKYDNAVTDPVHCELIVNDKRMIMARYPNEGFLYTEEPIKSGTTFDLFSEEWKSIRNPEGDIRRIDAETNERVKGWQSRENVWTFGYPAVGWADDTTPVVIDTDKREMKSEYVSLFGIRPHAPYYFFMYLKNWICRRNGIWIEKMVYYTFIRLMN